MIMKKVLDITEHRDGTYTLNHLTFEQMAAIRSALIQKSISLGELQMKKQADGLALNSWASSSLKFAVDASTQLLDMGF